MKLHRFNIWTFITIVAFFVLILFVLYPLLSLFNLSFTSPSTGQFSLEGYYTFITDHVYRSAMFNSLILSSVVTVFCLFIGVTMAFIVTRYELPFKNVIRTLPLLTLILPTIIVAESWILTAGRSGFVTEFLRLIGVELPSIYGWPGLIIVLTLQHWAFMFLMVSSAMGSIDASLEDAARNLGSSPMRTYLTVTFPVIAPSILASSLVVFTLVIENFGVPVILAESLPILSVEAYNEFVSEMGGSPLMASTLSMVLLLITTIVLIIQKRVIERKAYQMESGRSPRPRKLAPLPRRLVLIFCFGLIFLSLFSIIVCLVASLTKSIGPVLHYGQFSVNSYIKAFTLAPRAIFNSLFLATTATILGFIFATFTSYVLVKKRSKSTYLLDMLVMFPLAVAGTVLGISLITTFNKGFLVLTGSWTIMLVAYFVRKVPFAIRTSSSVLYNIKESIEEASINLGVSPLKSFFKVVMPLMMPALVAGALLMWVGTLAELAATIVLYFGEWSTMPIQIFQQIDSGEFGTASAYATVLIAAIFLPLFIAIKFFKVDVFAAK